MYSLYAPPSRLYMPQMGSISAHTIYTRQMSLGAAMKTTTVTVNTLFTPAPYIQPVRRPAGAAAERCSRVWTELSNDMESRATLVLLYLYHASIGAIQHAAHACSKRDIRYEIAIDTTRRSSDQSGHRHCQNTTLHTRMGGGAGGLQKLPKHTTENRRAQHRTPNPRTPPPAPTP